MAADFREWVRHPSTIVAIAVVVVGLMFVALEAQTSHWVYFTGERVAGTVEGGIVYYEVDGKQYTQDDPQVPLPPDGAKVGVYFYPDDPAAGVVDTPARWVEAAAMLVCFAGAVILVIVAALRRRARRARSDGRRHWLDQ